MELKKYVMLNNNVIYDMTNANDIKKYETVYRASALIYQFKKTSDNILDLVEVGDLVSGSQCIYASEVTRIDDKEIYTLIHCHWKNEITTIWKKQPNGDYKKYEVLN